MVSCRNLINQLTCRQVLNIMIILGFMINYMLRVNLSIAITEMVIPRNTAQNSTLSHNHYEHSAPINNINNTQLKNATNTEDVNINFLPDYELTDKRPQTTRYEWNEYEVNFILGAFFWGYFITQIPGGRLAEIIGGKRVFGCATLIAGITTLFTPIFASYGYKIIAALRIIIGLMLGATWPAILPMSLHWIPPTERSKFTSNLMASSLGVAITMPICGFLIASLGWESVFYFTGGVTCVWCTVWFFVIYDSPAQHPRISDEEKRYIEDVIGTTSICKAHSVPWKSILTSVPVWSIIIINFCNMFGYFTLINQLPTYMKYILNYNVKQNGLLTSLPYVGKYFFAVLTSTIADYMCRKKTLTVTTIRKIFTVISVLLPGICMIILSQFGYNRLVAVALFSFSLTVNGAVPAGYLTNILDISPNFSGTILGLSHTFSALTGYFSSFMVGTLTLNNQTYGQWRIIFGILAGLYIFGTLVYLIFSTVNIQKWNNLQQLPETGIDLISSSSDRSKNK